MENTASGSSGGGVTRHDMLHNMFASAVNHAVGVLGVSEKDAVKMMKDVGMNDRKRVSLKHIADALKMMDKDPTGAVECVVLEAVVWWATVPLLVQDRWMPGVRRARFPEWVPVELQGIGSLRRALNAGSLVAGMSGSGGGDAPSADSEAPTAWLVMGVARPIVKAARGAGAVEEDVQWMEMPDVDAYGVPVEYTYPEVKSRRGNVALLLMGDEGPRKVRPVAMVDDTIPVLNVPSDVGQVPRRLWRGEHRLNPVEQVYGNTMVSFLQKETCSVVDATYAQALRDDVARMFTLDPDEGGKSLVALCTPVGTPVAAVLCNCRQGEGLADVTHAVCAALTFLSTTNPTGFATHFGASSCFRAIALVF